ncbi:hypothetical protein DSCW_50520 [Desulfosarcina widdelii]|uniref:Outer membrane protein beta-barrel domain-containing protein n=1 Tax=Desulfosarcina widdelii TaxID=947919 RepID=A0A5K7ZA88_9BACT|nr:hypothetical protein DSCW_50520 [Desulfosarcina widdelii]
MGAAYDDNILYTEDEKVDSSILTVSPSVDLDYETLLSSVTLSADWDILTYLDESDLNRTNQYYELSGDRRFKERWKADIDLKYYDDTTLNTYLQETGRVIERVQRNFLEAGGDVDYDLTTVSGLSVGYRYQDASYDDDDFSDYYNHRGNLYYVHRLKTEVDRISIGPSYYYRKNDFNEVDSYSMDIGWHRDWSTVSYSFASIGARYAEVTDEDGSDDDSWGARARIDLSFDGETSTTLFRYFHDLRTTSQGDDINVDNFYFSYRQLLTERFRAGINARLVFSYKLLDRQSDVNDSRYYWLEPNLTYDVMRNLRVSLSYRYQNNVESGDDGERDITRERNVFWLQFSYSWTTLF